MPSTNPSSKCSSEKLMFHCNQNAAIILGNLQDFYEGNEFFDTILIAGHKRVRIEAHRVILCAFSKFFLKIFRDSQSASTNLVELNEIEASTLKLIVDFMYSGSIELTLENVEKVLRAALFLKIVTLIKGCCELLEQNIINSRNSLQHPQLQNEQSLPSVKGESYTYFENIAKKMEHLTLSENELKDLLFNDNLHGDLEENVFLAMVEWINHDKLNRQHLGFQLLSRIRFQALTPKFIVENRKSVCKSVDSYELICSWLQWHLSPETRSTEQQRNTLKPTTNPDGRYEVIEFTYPDKIGIFTFNPKINTWSIQQKTIMPIEKLNSSLIKIDNKILLVGGLMPSQRISRSVECFDLTTFERTDLPPMTKTRFVPKLADLNGYLCVFGHNYPDTSKSMEIYNFSTRQWNDVEPLREPSTSSQIAAHNGILYILDFEYGFLQSYDVSSNEWTLKTIEQNSSMGHFGMAVHGGFLYVVDIQMGEAYKTETVIRYNFSNDSWCKLASFEYAYNIYETKVYGNKIMLVDYEGVVSEYNMETNTWNTICPFKDLTVSFTVNIIYNKIV